jgi:DNA polymerase III epsilon subunit-like protein|tara:strand:+ start:803 stop:1474 length:672 start_codon:yes stop_codon:yes gene_type:complete
MELYWDETPIHVIDFEGGPQCGIVEFGVVTLKGFSIESVATRICRPKAAISKREQAVHGIGTLEASSERPFQDEWDRFAGLRETGPLSAHFASAENSMLKSVFPYPRQSPSWVEESRSVANWGPWLDTGVLYREIGGARDSLNLKKLINSHELQDDLDALGRAHCPDGRQKYHCALFDALASALLLSYYCREFCDERLTLLQLVARSQGNSVKRQKVEQRELF